jgi:DNA-directed RNA polymerase subunit F
MSQVRVVLKSVWDDKGIKNAQKSFQGISDGITTAFKAIGVATVAAGAAIAKLSADSIKAASSLQESTNAVNVAFGKSADEVLKIGENAAQSLGLARTEFNQAAVRFSAFAERVVGEGGDVAGFIGDITTRAADFASVFNIEVAEALQVFQSGLSGEAEPLKRFGINLLESEVKAYALRTGLIKVGETMTEQEKVQARYGLLLESTAKTAGDFANTSDSLANRQRILKATFTDIQAEIGTAMLPAFEALVGVVVDDLLPIFKDLGEKIGPAVAGVLEFIGEVFAEARTSGTNLNRALGDLKRSFDLLFSAITNGQKDAKGFSDLLSNLVRIIEFLVTTGASFVAFIQGAGVAIEAFKRGDLGTYFRFLTTDTIEFMESVEGTTGAVTDLGTQGSTAAGHIRDLDNLKLNNLRKQIGDTAGELNRFRNIAQGFIAPNAATTAATTSTTTAVSKNVESAFDKVRKFIQNSQKDLARAQEQYNKTIAAAQKRYAEAVIKTETDFANKLAGIVQQSQDRLRTAFESVVRISLADIFEVEETKSVANLVQGLTTRLAKSQALLEKAGKLNAAGFSQTFIEQVVQAGTDTGNELASAILESTPQTQAELQRLFLALESTAETGMDSLAREIYNKQGLATRELKNLYVQTQTELTEALKQLQLDFNQEVIDANLALVEAVKKIREAFQENIESMKGDLGGLDKVVSEFLKKLGQVETKAEEKIQNITGTTPGATGGAAGGGMTGINMAASAVTDATGIFIDSMSDVTRVINYLQERINAANEFANQSAIAGRTAEAMSAVNLRNQFRSQLGMIQTLGSGAVGTTININVKTDSTQSLAMVGKTLGNTITKYVSAGGQVLVSPTN